MDFKFAFYLTYLLAIKLKILEFFAVFLEWDVNLYIKHLLSIVKNEIDQVIKL